MEGEPLGASMNQAQSRLILLLIIVIISRVLLQSPGWPSSSLSQCMVGCTLSTADSFSIFGKRRHRCSEGLNTEDPFQLRKPQIHSLLLIGLVGVPFTQDGCPLPAYPDSALLIQSFKATLVERNVPTSGFRAQPPGLASFLCLSSSLHPEEEA